jgi:hypothetical protein
VDLPRGTTRCHSSTRTRLWALGPVVVEAWIDHIHLRVVRIRPKVP